MEIISESIFARELIGNIIFVGLYFCKDLYTTNVYKSLIFVKVI
jgi:hypothetical protein